MVKGRDFMEKSWMDKLSEKIMDANKVDAISSTKEMISYFNEIISSMFNVEQLKGRNFEYKVTDDGVIQLKIFNHRLTVVADDFRETIAIRFGEVSGIEDYKLIGVVTLGDKLYHSADGSIKEKFTGWHLEKILKENFEV